MPIGKRPAAEFIGTFWLVLGGCGSAVLAAAFPAIASANQEFHASDKRWRDMAEAERVLGALDPARLLEVTDRAGEPQTALAILLRTAHHWGVHTGQIVFATKARSATVTWADSKPMRRKLACFFNHSAAATKVAFFTILILAPLTSCFACSV